MLEKIILTEPHIYVINVTIIKGLWVRLCKWQLSLSNKIESFILISFSVEDFNFGCNKIVQPKKGEYSLALLLQLVFNSLLMVLRIVIKLLLSWASTFFPISNHFFGQLNKFSIVEGPFLLSFLESFSGFFIHSQSLCFLLYQRLF